MKKLVACVSADDPYCRGAVQGTEWAGPVLVAAGVGAFDVVVLCHVPGLGCRVQPTVEALRQRFPRVALETVELSGDTPQMAARFMDWWRNAPHTLPEEITVLVDPCPTDVAAAWISQWAHARLPARFVRLEGGADAAVGHHPVLVEALPAPREPGNGVLREPTATYGDRPAVADASTDPADEQSRIQRMVRRVGILGAHPGLRRAIETTAAVAPHPVPLLIEGETGVGKGLFGRLAHALSGRPGEGLVLVNCGALPERLVESTLFGHRKGAFTGAVADVPGKFVLADGGTLFLDEVGELPPALQPKLLRVLDDGVVEPVGATRGTKVDVRIIAATNRDMRQAVQEGVFRQDLYYRLAYGVVRIPPLRDRREDIHLIALAVLGRLNQRLQSPKQFTPGALRRLEAQPWPGNVRELENVIGRSVLQTPGPVIDARDLALDGGIPCPDSSASLPDPHEGFSLEDYLSSTRRSLILRALELGGGNQSAAARLLGVTPQAVHRFLHTEAG